MTDGPEHKVVPEKDEAPPAPPVPETPAAPPAAPAVPSEAPDWAQALGSTVSELGKTVTTLVDLITGTVGGNEDPPPPDETPVKVPWTHRKLFG